MGNFLGIIIASVVMSAIQWGIFRLFKKNIEYIQLLGSMFAVNFLITLLRGFK